MWKTLLTHESAPEPVEVAIQRLTVAEGVLAARCGETQHEVRFDRHPGGGVLHLHGRVVPFYATVASDHVNVWMGGNVFQFHIEQPAGGKGASAARAGAAARGGAHAVATDEIAAPMPGTVLKINVAAGDSFAAHQALLVLESMKMEMALSAPVAGMVGEVLCRQSELVQMGQVLLKLKIAE